MALYNGSYSEPCGRLRVHDNVVGGHAVRLSVEVRLSGVINNLGKLPELFYFKVVHSEQS